MPRYPAISRTYPLVPLGQPQARLKPRQWRRAAELEGFSPSEALQMSQIVHGEAGYQPGVVQPDPGDGMVGRGGVQATPNAWGADSEAMRYYQKLGGDRAMGNPRKAMRMARFLYEKAGNSFAPWYGTKYLQQNVGNVPSVLRGRRGARAPMMNDSGPKNSLMLTGIPQVEVGSQTDNPVTHLIGIFNRMNEATGLGPSFQSALAPSLNSSSPSVFDPMKYLTQVSSPTPKAPSVGSPGGGKKAKNVNFQPHGGWGGTEGAMRSIFDQYNTGLQITSTKRDNQNPYSGRGSDHDFGNKDAYAIDASNGSQPTPEMDEYAFKVARALGNKDYKKGTPLNWTTTIDGIRYQLIYRGTGAAFGGNHMNHVHLGAKRVG